MKIFDYMNNCVICNKAELEYRDSMSVLDDERIYRISCKCGKKAIGTDAYVVVKEWNRISQLDMEEYENG